VGLYAPPFEYPLPSLTTPTAPALPVRNDPTPAPGVPPGQAIIARVRASVVKVLAEAPAADRRGTGFVVAPRLVLTCAHLVQSTSGIVLLLADGRQVPAAIERLDALNDLALLSTTVDLPPALAIDETGRVEPGEPVAVTGFPADGTDGMGGGDLTVTGALAGWVTRSSPAGERVEMLQLFADIRPGHSGGPVYSLRDGRVFGVMSFRVTGAQTTGYATGGPMLRQFLGSGSPRPVPSEFPVEN
jgi:S1-C subfamily serine protease